MEANVGEQALLTINAASDASIDLLQLIGYRGVPGQFIAIIIVRCYLTLSDDAIVDFDHWLAPFWGSFGEPNSQIKRLEVGKTYQSGPK
jgi:hypothetical protein